MPIETARRVTARGTSAVEGVRKDGGMFASRSVLTPRFTSGRTQLCTAPCRTSERAFSSCDERCRGRAVDPRYRGQFCMRFVFGHVGDLFLPDLLLTSLSAGGTVCLPLKPV